MANMTQICILLNFSEHCIIQTPRPDPRPDSGSYHSDQSADSAVSYKDKPKPRGGKSVTNNRNSDDSPQSQISAAASHRIATCDAYSLWTLLVISQFLLYTLVSNVTKRQHLQQNKIHTRKLLYCRESGISQDREERMCIYYFPMCIDTNHIRDCGIFVILLSKCHFGLTEYHYMH